MSANPRSLAGEEIDADPAEIQQMLDETASALNALTPLFDLVTSPGWAALEDWLNRQEWAAIERLTTASTTADMVTQQARISLLREIRSLPAVTRQTVSQLSDTLEVSEGDES